MASINTSDNKYGVAKWIVDATAGAGTHTTIAGALTSASSGDTIFIRPGIYTENITGKAGVNLTAFGCDGLASGQGAIVVPNVIILGTVTLSFAGTASFTGIQFKTNGAAAISNSGSNAANFMFSQCSFYSADSTAISCTGTLSNWTFSDCVFNQASTNKFFASNGNWDVENCVFGATGSPVASTIATGNILMNSCDCNGLFITTSDTGTLTANASTFQCGGSTFLTTAGTGTSLITSCYINSTSASALSAGTGTTISIANCEISSSNTNAITGAGTLKYGNLTFTNTSNTMNTTTQTAYVTRPGITLSAHQPAFLAYVGTTITNVTGDGTVYTIIFDNEVYDQNNDFNLGTSTFTAPYTGRYLVHYQVTIQGVTSFNNTGTTKLVTSNRTYRSYPVTNVGSTTICEGFLNTPADMDAGDTFTVTIATSDTGGKIDDVSGTTGGELQTFVSASLIC